MSGSRHHVFSLSTHQFRVRHVQAVCVKRLQCDETPNSFICIVHPSTQELVLQSDVYHHSHNPQWSLHGEPLIQPIASFRELIVQVWVEGSDGENTLHLEWFVSLPALTYLAEKTVNDVVFGPDTLLFVVGDVYLYATHGIYPAIGPNAVVQEEDLKKPYCDVPLRDVCISYTFSSLYSLHAMYGSVASSREQCNKLKQSITLIQQEDEGMALKCRVRALRQMLDKSSAALTKESSSLMTKQSVWEEKHARRNSLRADLRHKEHCMSEELHSIDWKLKLVIKKKRQLLKRRQKLLQQLSTVFPIEQGTGSNMTVCGVELNLTEHISTSGIEEQLGAGLGYTSHIVCLVSSILDAPLRFPLNPCLSHSTVRDDITEKLDEKRVLPLFVRGKDRFYFNYGVFLLNRNIAQLRHHCGMKTEELKDTLSNLRDLLVGRLAGNMSRHPPAKLVSHDRLYSLHRTKDPFKKTHKRVRSAPISYTIVTAEGPVSQDDQYLSRSVTSYSAASSASSWHSNVSLGTMAMGGSMDMLRETTETTAVQEDLESAEFGQSADYGQSAEFEQSIEYGQSAGAEFGQSTEFGQSHSESVTEYGVEYGNEVEEDQEDDVEVDGEYYDAEDTVEPALTVEDIEARFEAAEQSTVTIKRVMPHHSFSTITALERPVTMVTLEKPVLNNLLEKPVLNNLLDQPLVNKVLDQPLVNNVVEKPRVNNVLEQPRVNNVLQRTASNDLLEQSVINDMNDLLIDFSDIGSTKRSHTLPNRSNSAEDITLRNHGNSSSPILEVRETSSGDTVQIISFDKLNSDPPSHQRPNVDV